MNEKQPEYYDIIPEFNNAGRLCNYHTGVDGQTVRIHSDEFERFNQLAGRQHEIVDGVVMYNSALESCMPDDGEETQSDTRMDENDVAMCELAKTCSEIEVRLAMLEGGGL